MPHHQDDLGARELAGELDASGDVVVEDVSGDPGVEHAFAVVLTVRWLTHRDSAAETVGWGAVRDLPGAGQSGLGILLLTPRENATPAPVVAPTLENAPAAEKVMRNTPSAPYAAT